MRKIFELFPLLLLAATLPGVAAERSPATRVEKGSLVMEGIPEIPPRVSERLQQYQNTRGASLRGWHPSGEGILISTRFGETQQVHWVKTPGGARRQITFFDEPISTVEVSPDPELDGFVFARDVGGSEFFQLYFFDMSSGSHRLLTDGSSRHGSVSVSNRGDRVAFYTTQRNGRDWDVHVAGLRQPASSQAVLARGGQWTAGDWSPDDSKLLVTRLVSAAESHPHVLDLATGELTAIDAAGEPVAYSAAAWRGDGRGIYFASDRDSEFKRLRHLDLESGKVEVLTADIPWDVVSISVSPDGRWLAFTVNAGGVGKLHLWRAGTHEAVALPELPTGRIGRLSWSPDSRRLGMVLNTPRSPADVYVLEPGGGLERWTESEVGGLDSGRFVVPDLVEYETFDEIDGEPRKIPAFYYRAASGRTAAADQGPRPVLVLIHGGPEGQHRPSFSPWIQYLVGELGVAVVAPNVRGSRGYGKTYLKLDNGYLREDSVKDVGALLRWISARPELDGERVLVYGGSYGGYMVLAAMTHYNDRLRGGVDVVGISHFVTFLENTRDYRRDLRRVEYGDERDPEMRAFLERIAPLANAHKITRPLFIAQGLNDPRVPASEAEQILAAVRANGGEPWYFLARDEGHGFKKKSNRDAFMSAAALFVERVLLDGQ